MVVESVNVASVGLRMDVRLKFSNIEPSSGSFRSILLYEYESLVTISWIVCTQVKSCCFAQY